MSLSDITVTDTIRVLSAAKDIFQGVDLSIDDLRGLAAADPATFSNPPPSEDNIHQLAQKLRAALTKKHGQGYVDELWERFRK